MNGWYAGRELEISAVLNRDNWVKRHACGGVLLIPNHLPLITKLGGGFEKMLAKVFGL